MSTLILTREGLASSIFAVGGTFGALASQFISERFVPSTILLLNSAVFIFASLLKARSVNVWMLVLGRFIWGISTGVAYVFVPLLLNDALSNFRRSSVFFL